MRIMRWFIVIGSLVVLAAMIFGFFAGTASEYDCDDVAREARRIAGEEGAGIERIENVEELSSRYGRGESERRCRGEATFADGESATVYMRGYDEGGNVMVSISTRPFEDEPRREE